MQAITLQGHTNSDRTLHLSLPDETVEGLLHLPNMSRFSSSERSGLSLGSEKRMLSNN